MKYLFKITTKPLICSLLLVLTIFSSSYSTAEAFIGIPTIIFEVLDAGFPAYQASLIAPIEACDNVVLPISIAKPATGFVARASDAVTLGIAGIAADTKTTAAITSAKGVCKGSKVTVTGIQQTAITIKQQVAAANAMAQIDAAIAKLEAMQQEIDTHHSLSQKVFWKAIFSKVFLTVSKTLVTRMVSKLNTVYKINDFGKYADAVGSVVYQSQRIKDETDDKVSQSMMRSMIIDNAFVNQLHPAARAAAQRNIGFKVKDVSFNDGDLLDKVFTLGLPSSDPVFIDSTTRQNANTAAAKAVADAAREIQQSSYKSPRTCDEAKIGQQKIVDDNYNKRLQETTELLQAWLKLQSDYDRAGGKIVEDAQGSANGITQQDVDDLENAYNRSLDSLDQFPRDANNSAVVIACGSINSPAEFIGGRIGTMLDNYAKNISDPKTDNMPIAIAAVADIASSFASKLILGIGDGSSSSKSKSNVINEDAKLASGTADGIDYQTEGAGDPAGEAQSKIKLDYTRGQKEGEITITWDASERKNAESVRLEGPGVVSTDEKDGPSTSLRGSYDVTITEDSTFTLTVLVKATAKNPEPKVKTLQVPLVDPNINTRGDDGSAPDGGPGQVQGQFSRISIQPRGPILPRN